MKELDNEVDIFESALTNYEANKARIITNFQEMEKELNEEMQGTGMDQLNFTPIVKAYKRVVMDLYVANESIIKLLKNHTSRVHSIAQSAETNDTAIADIQELLQRKTRELDEVNKNLVLRDADITRLKEENVRLRELAKKGTTPTIETVAVPTRKEETLASRHDELLEQLKNSVDKFKALQDLKELNPKNYPPSIWPKRIDFMPSRTDLVDGRYPKEWGEQRIAIETQLRELPKDDWIEDRFTPTKRVKPTDARALWEAYGVCHECGATYYKAGPTMKDVVRCNDCEARRIVIAEYNNAQDETDFMIEPLTGLTIALFTEVFGEPKEALPEYFYNDSLLKHWKLLTNK